MLITVSASEAKRVGAAPAGSGEEESSKHLPTEEVNDVMKGVNETHEEMDTTNITTSKGHVDMEELKRSTDVPVTVTDPDEDKSIRIVRDPLFRAAASQSVLDLKEFLKAEEANVDQIKGIPEKTPSTTSTGHAVPGRTSKAAPHNSHQMISHTSTHEADHDLEKFSSTTEDAACRAVLAEGEVGLEQFSRTSAEGELPEHFRPRWRRTAEDYELRIRRHYYDVITSVPVPRRAATDDDDKKKPTSTNDLDPVTSSGDPAVTSASDPAVTPVRDPYELTILLLGSPDAGRSTLVDVIYNHLMGADFDDNRRYHIAERGPVSPDKYCEADDWIVCHTIPPRPGGRVPLTLHVVDTPGVPPPADTPPPSTHLSTRLTHALGASLPRPDVMLLVVKDNVADLPKSVALCAAALLPSLPADCPHAVHLAVTNHRPTSRLTYPSLAALGVRPHKQYVFKRDFLDRPANMAFGRRLATMADSNITDLISVFQNDVCRLQELMRPLPQLEQRLPLDMKYILTDDSKKLHHYRVSTLQPGQPHTDTRTVLLVGAAGAGKTSLVDVIVNYALYDTPDELQHVAMPKEGFTTCYGINFPIMPFALNLVDTPGLLELDPNETEDNLMERIISIIADPASLGIRQVDVVALVVKGDAPYVPPAHREHVERLTHALRDLPWVRPALMYTHADTDTPVAAIAMARTGFPDDNKFAFNSRAFCRTTDVECTALWEMGRNSFDSFITLLKTSSAPQSPPAPGLTVKDVVIATDPATRVQHVQVGEPDHVGRSVRRTVLLCGACGGGRTALSELLLNFALRRTADQPRYTFTNQSDADWIQCVTVKYPTPDHRLLTLTLVDTPGLVGPSTTQTDSATLTRLTAALTHPSSLGLTRCDVIALVTPHEMTGSLTDADILEKFAVLTRQAAHVSAVLVRMRADSARKPNLSALCGETPQFEAGFAFNKLAFGDQDSSVTTHAFWEIGKQNFDDFIAYLMKLPDQQHPPPPHVAGPPKETAGGQGAAHTDGKREEVLGGRGTGSEELLDPVAAPVDIPEPPPPLLPKEDAERKLRLRFIGEPVPPGSAPTLVLVGPAGTGRTSFVDVLANYGLQAEAGRGGVYTCQETDSDWITCYTLATPDGRCNVIDTPGLYGPEDPQHDDQLIQRLCDVIDDPSYFGVRRCDVIGIVVDGGTARVTAHVADIMDKVGRVLAGGPRSVLLALHCDSPSPAAARPLAQLGLPTRHAFAFNTLAFSGAPRPAQLYWELGRPAYTRLMGHLKELPGEDERSLLTPLPALPPPPAPGAPTLSLTDPELRIRRLVIGAGPVPPVRLTLLLLAPSHASLTAAAALLITHAQRYDVTKPSADVTEAHSDVTDFKTISVDEITAQCEEDWLVCYTVRLGNPGAHWVNIVIAPATPPTGTSPALQRRVRRMLMDPPPQARASSPPTPPLALCCVVTDLGDMAGVNGLSDPYTRLLAPPSDPNTTSSPATDPPGPATPGSHPPGPPSPSPPVAVLTLDPHVLTVYRGLRTPAVFYLPAPGEGVEGGTDPQPGEADGGTDPGVTPSPRQPSDDVSNPRDSIQSTTFQGLWTYLTA